MRGPIGPPFCCHLATATRQQSRILRCLAPPSQACCAWPFHAALCQAAPSLPILALPHQATPATTYTARPCLPGLPRLTCLTSPYRARPPLPATPVRPRLSLPADPCLPDHACQTLRFLDRSWPRHAVPANPAVRRHPFHACQSEPVLQHLAMPAAPSTPDPAMPSLPLLPCRARTCPRGLACRALP